MFKIGKINKDKYLRYGLFALVLISVSIGLASRFWNLSVIAERIFDEVYFPIFANDFLHGKQAFDVHPPLGKFFIAIGIYIFGDNSFGWRIMPALFGVGNIALFYFLAKKYFHKEKEALIFGIIALFLIAIEPIYIAYSRVGLMDGILFFFIFLSFFMALRVKNRKDVLWLCVVIGLAFSIKWVALAVLVPIAYIMWQKKRLAQFFSLLSFGVLVYLIVVWVGFLIGGQSSSMNKIVEWNIQAWNYHHLLKDKHPWGSPWWSWPLMLRPILMWFDEPNKDGIFRVITGIGNPVLWYGATLSVLISSLYLIWAFIKNWRDALHHPLVPLLLGYFSFLLPWALVDRVVFIYHYLPCYGFALLIVTYWLGLLWHKSRVAMLNLLLILLLVSIFFLPMVTAIGMNQPMINLHIWVNSWLY